MDIPVDLDNNILPHYDSLASQAAACFEKHKKSNTDKARRFAELGVYIWNARLAKRSWMYAQVVRNWERSILGK